jgi:hypothetical protein
MARRGGALIVTHGLDRTVTLDAFLALVRCQDFVRELRPFPPRRFRFDVAWPVHRVALEIQGGVFVGGHHVRGENYEDDCEKILIGAMEGWRVLPLTWRMIERTPANLASALDQIIACANPHHEKGGGNG